MLWRGGSRDSTPATGRKTKQWTNREKSPGFPLIDAGHPCAAPPGFVARAMCRDRFGALAVCRMVLRIPRSNGDTFTS